MGVEGTPEPDVHIHYLRPPGREQVFHQHLIHEDPGPHGVKVTLARGLELDAPVRVEGNVVLERGSDVVWLTFPGAWHDIGRFHTADDAFTGWYANILTPPTFHEGGVWRTTDLFLDVWIPGGGGALRVLDEDEFAEGVERGWIDRETEERARREVRTLVEGHARGEWPPEAAREWDLARARRALRRRSPPVR